MGYGTLLVRSSSVLADFGYWYAWYALGTLQYTLVHLQYTLSIPSVYLSIPQYTKYTPVRSSTVRPQYGTQVYTRNLSQVFKLAIKGFNVIQDTENTILILVSQNNILTTFVEIKSKENLLLFLH